MRTMPSGKGKNHLSSGILAQNSALKERKKEKNSRSAGNKMSMLCFCSRPDRYAGGFLFTVHASVSFSSALTTKMCHATYVLMAVTVDAHLVRPTNDMVLLMKSINFPGSRRREEQRHRKCVQLLFFIGGGLINTHKAETAFRDRFDDGLDGYNGDGVIVSPRGAASMHTQLASCLFEVNRHRPRLSSFVYG